MDFYDEFLTKKEVNKGNKEWTWPVIGAVVEKEQSTIRVAFKNKSLTSLEKNALTEKYLSNELPKDSNVSKKSLNDYSDLEIVEYVAQNIERFKKIESFNFVTGIKKLGELEDKLNKLQDRIIG